jgi:hypothetical protein
MNGTKIGIGIGGLVLGRRPFQVIVFTYLYLGIEILFAIFKGKTAGYWQRIASGELSENRDMPAAKRFFTKALSSPHNQLPRVDKNPAYPTAVQQLKDKEAIK